MQAQRYIIRHEDGEQLLAVGAHVTILLSSDATNGAVAVLEHRVPPQGGPPPHTHCDTELLYILSGKFAVTVGSEQTEVEKGALIHVPPGTVHTTRNIGTRAGRQLSLYLPGGAEGFFREAGRAVTNADMLPDFDQPANLTGVDMAHIVMLAARYGMRVQPDAGPKSRGAV